MKYITAITSIVTALGVIIAIIQLIYLIKQYKKSHEEERRKESVNVLMEWSKSLKKSSLIAARIIKDFDANQCKKLYDYKPFYIEKETKDLLCNICTSQTCNNSDECKVENGKYKLSGKQLSNFRYFIIRHLNLIECVLTAWKENIVDKDLIEKEFIFLLDNNFENFIRYTRAISSFPITIDFIEAIRSKYRVDDNDKL